MGQLLRKHVIRVYMQIIQFMNLPAYDITWQDLKSNMNAMDEIAKANDLFAIH